MTEFDISQSPQLARFLALGFEAAAKRALLSTAHRVINHIIVDILPAEKHQPVDRGIYRAGWRAKAIPKGAEILNTVPYASVIEYGARAGNIKVGSAMIAALTSWIVRKGLADSKEAPRMAWAVAMSMKKKGIYNGGKGLRVLERALKKVPEFLAVELPAEIAREFRRG